MTGDGASQYSVHAPTSGYSLRGGEGGSRGSVGVSAAECVSGLGGRRAEHEARRLREEEQVA